MNNTSAKEWLTKSWHNLSTAILLYDVNHYTDIIAANDSKKFSYNMNYAWQTLQYVEKMD